MTANDRKNDGLTPRQEAAALALAAGQSICEAATACRAGEKTVRRWLSRPEFRRRIHELRAEATELALGRMTAALAEAVGALQDLLRAEAPSVRLGAAKTMIEWCLRLRENTELENRLAVLEQLVVSKYGNHKQTKATQNGYDGWRAAWPS